MASLSSEEGAGRVLELVRGLSTEVRPSHASRIAVTLDSSFDDPGIGSLELAELVMRAQDSFGVAHPAGVLSNRRSPTTASKRSALQRVSKFAAVQHRDR
jgi:acyl carrier protein